MRKSQKRTATDAFLSLRGMIDDTHIISELDKIESSFSSLTLHNTKFTKQSKSNLVKKWQNLRKVIISHFIGQELYSSSDYISNYINKSQEIFSRLSVSRAYPADDSIGYGNYIDGFRDILTNLKSSISHKEFDGLSSELKKFAHDVKQTYIAAFTYANIDHMELSKMLSSLKKYVNKINQISNESEMIEPPDSLLEIDNMVKRIANMPSESESSEEFEVEDNRKNSHRNTLKNSQKNSTKNSSKNSLRNSKNNSRNNSTNNLMNNSDESSDHHIKKNDILDKINKLSIDDLTNAENNKVLEINQNSNNITQNNDEEVQTLVELFSDIDACADRLDNLSQYLNPQYNNQNSLIKVGSILAGEVRFLRKLKIAKVSDDLIRQNMNLKTELRRARDAARLLSKSKSGRSEIDVEKLQKLTKDEIIAITVSLLSEGKINVPLELTFCEGTPEEFKELSKQYKESAQYAEKAALALRRLEAEKANLEAENKMLKAQALTFKDEDALRIELESIDERAAAIEDRLQQRMADGVKGKRDYETAELNEEVDDLLKRRKEIKMLLAKRFPKEAKAEIEVLKQANKKLQKCVNDNVDEIESLRKQLLEMSKKLAQQAPKLSSSKSSKLSSNPSSKNNSDDDINLKLNKKQRININESDSDEDYIRKSKFQKKSNSTKKSKKHHNDSESDDTESSDNDDFNFAKKNKNMEKNYFRKNSSKNKYNLVPTESSSEENDSPKKKSKKDNNTKKEWMMSDDDDENIFQKKHNSKNLINDDQEKKSSSKKNIRDEIYNDDDIHQYSNKKANPNYYENPNMNLNNNYNNNMSYNNIPNNNPNNVYYNNNIPNNNIYSDYLYHNNNNSNINDMNDNNIPLMNGIKLDATNSVRKSKNDIQKKKNGSHEDKVSYDDEISDDSDNYVRNSKKLSDSQKNRGIPVRQKKIPLTPHGDI